MITICRWRSWILGHRIWTLLVLLVVAVLVIYWLLTRPGAMFGPQDGTWRRMQINKDMYVGIDPSYPPFAQWTADGPIGLEADIAREIARRLGVKPTLLIMGYDGLYNSLYTGEVDYLISGLHVDEGQTNWVYYTRSYFDAGQILVSPEDSPIQSMRDLDGKTVAVELASTGDREARRWERRLHALTITRHMLPNEAMQAVQAGEADAALVDTISARLYLKDHPDLVMARHTTVSDGYVIALRKKNFRLSEAIDQALKDMIEDGTMDKIIARWL